MDEQNLRADLIGLSLFWGLMLVTVINIGISHNSVWIERLGVFGLLLGALSFGLSIAFNLTGLPALRSAGLALTVMCFVFGLGAWFLAVTR